MVLPTLRKVHLPLLKVIEDAGGELRAKEAVRLVTVHFPDISDADLARVVPSGGKNTWVNRVQWARQDLVITGEIDKSVPGVWRITPKGRLRLQEEWPRWSPTSSSGPIQQPVENKNQSRSFQTLVDDESKLYGAVKQWLEDTWGKDIVSKGDYFWVRDTSTQSRRDKLGKWSRPDITFVQVNRFEYLPESSVEVSTFEVKRFNEATNLASVYEAASHQRWAHHTFMVAEIPGTEYSLPDNVTGEAGRFGVGLFVMHRGSSGNEYEIEEVIGSARQNPDPKEVDGMLRDFFSDNTKESKKFRDLIR